MMKKIKQYIQAIKLILDNANHTSSSQEDTLLALGKLLCQNIVNKSDIKSIKDVEFKIFSQFGDDGIIQWLIHKIDLPNETFIEFGVADYMESNTRFLLMNNNWSGLIIDGSESNISKITKSNYYWRHDLEAKCAFVNVDNINNLILSAGFEKDVGILHIDIDGNDYWIWKTIDVISPVIVIVEYNSVFGCEKAITTPYDPAFIRTNAHHSNLYFGASIKAFHILAKEKGYTFIGCNSAGNNAYFVRSDKLNDDVQEVSLQEGYVCSKFREARDLNGVMTYISGAKRISIIKGLPVHNIETNTIEYL